MHTPSIDMLLDQSHDLLADSGSSPPSPTLMPAHLLHLMFFLPHFVRTVVKNKHLRSSNLPQLQEGWRELVSHKATSVKVTLLPASC